MEPHTYLYNSDRPDNPTSSSAQSTATSSGASSGSVSGPVLNSALPSRNSPSTCATRGKSTGSWRVLRFLRGNPSDGITYTRGLLGSNQIQVFADSDWASDQDSRRSTDGHCALRNGGTVSESCMKHPCVAHSSAEAEFMEASKAALQVVWLRRTLAAFGHHQRGATPLGEDNRACQLMSEAAGQMDRVKHIDLRDWSLKEKVAEGVVRLHAVPDALMPTDIFTKALPLPTFERHCAVLQGLARPLPMLSVLPL